MSKWVMKSTNILRITFLFVFFFLNLITGWAQEESESKWKIHGYLKSLQGFYNIAQPTTGRFIISDSYIHHRLNIDYYASQHFTLKSGIRTRFFFGELSRLTPEYGNRLSEGGNDVVNLTLLNAHGQVTLHSIVDRAYLDYTKGNFELKFGRQRINWGINTIWNPNDLFNAYSFTDFDYAERPGTDALRIRYFIGFAGSIEFAVKTIDNSDEIVAAGLYKFNKNDYDFQLLGGWSGMDIVLGGGWAGNIKQVGFKGEFSWFKSTDDDIENSFALAMSADYSFKNGFFLIGGLLYNDAGRNDANSNLLVFDLSARNLYPYSWTTFVQASYPVTPLINTAMSIVYSPVAGHPVFLSPTIGYSLGTNLDVDLISQFILQNGMEGYGSQANVFYLRMTWNY